MAILAHDEAVKPQLRETPVTGANPRREHVLNRSAHRLDDLLLVKLLVTGAGVRVRV